MDALRRRFAEAKLADDARNTLIEVLLQRVDDMQKTMERSAFVLVLIDGDCMNFLNDLVKQGIAGGDEAVKLLQRSIFEYLRYDESFKHDQKIVIKVYANVRGLSKAYVTNGILPNPAAFGEFVLGFNKAHPLCDFIDAGNHKEATDSKLKEVLRLYVYNVHCKQILFGASADNGYASFLSSFFIDTDISSRLKLLKGPPFSFEFKNILPRLQWTEFRNVFRSELITHEFGRHHTWRKGHESEPPSAQESASTIVMSDPSLLLLSKKLEGDTGDQVAQIFFSGVDEGMHAISKPDTSERAHKQVLSFSAISTSPPRSLGANANPREGEVFAALIGSTYERLKESPRALDFAVVKQRAERALGVTPEFWGKSEQNGWFLKSKNVIKMAVEDWVERTDNPPPKNATWMLQYFHPGQSPSSVMKSPSAENWRIKNP